MPMDTKSPPTSPLRQCFENLQSPTTTTTITVLDEEWQQRAEEELNETPENYKQKMNALRLQVLSMSENCNGGIVCFIQFDYYVKGEIYDDANLRVPDDDEFLLRFLRARKFDNQKAFSMLQRYCLMKLKCPELFACALPSKYGKVFELQAQYMLPQRDQLGRRIYVIRVDNFDSTRVSIDEIFRSNVLALEQIVREPETQIAGIALLLDMGGLNLHHVKFFTPYYARKMVELVQETFPLRFKGFHIVNEPFYFDAIMTILKPFLKEKIRKRIFLHGSDLSSLHAFLPQHILPKEYGGTAGSFDNRSWYLDLLSQETYFKHLQQYGYKTEE